MSERPHRTGRPLKRAAPGTRASLGLKVTGEIKERLDAAAQANGRTQSQEAEVRLEQSFRNEDLLPQILDAVYGRETAGLLLLLGRCIKDASNHAAFSEAHSLEAVEKWMDHPWAFQQTVEAVQLVLETLRPVGTSEPPRHNAALAAISETLRESANNIGRGLASSILHSVVAPDDAVLGHEMQPVRDRLSRVVSRLEGDVHAR
jgi:hypothetical protein